MLVVLLIIIDIMCSMLLLCSLIVKAHSSSVFFGRAKMRIESIEFRASLSFYAIREGLIILGYKYRTLFLC